jgi:hypothetical protein
MLRRSWVAGLDLRRREGAGSQPPLVVQREARRDREEPGRDRRRPLERKSRERAERSKEGFLGEILDVGVRAHDSVEERRHRSLVVPDEARVGGLIAHVAERDRGRVDLAGVRNRPPLLDEGGGLPGCGGGKNGAQSTFRRSSTPESDDRSRPANDSFVQRRPQNENAACCESTRRRSRARKRMGSRVTSAARPSCPA